MYMIAIFLLLAVVGFLVATKSYDGLEITWLAVGWLSVLGLIFCIALIPVYRSQAYDQLAQHDALEATYTQLRSNQNPMEMATVGRDVAEWNAWLASAQYWHNTQWSPYWPEAVMYAKPIR